MALRELLHEIMSKLNIDQFAADVCNTISECFNWNQFVTAMEEKGYTKTEIDHGFKKIGERVGMDL